MNRINQLFQQKPSGILSVYFCAGHPKPDGTLDTLRALQAGGVDMVEIGIPFSDPLADGPVIQNAASASLRGGMSVRKLLEQLRDVRREIHIPLILMGYLNPIAHYGFEKFCSACKEIGIDGLIIPDLPFEVYEKEFSATAKAYGIEFIFLVTPETPEDRIRRIDAATDGFIYAVSSAAVTGAQKSFNEAKQAYFTALQNMGLRNPFLIGFGISNYATRSAADAHAAGVIVGSKFVTMLEQTDSPAAAVAALQKALAE
ncbi:MAG: tryptophan synthase subunit alpha [Bacteroidales bacterium]|nr:tryptophan synthase subunit alpha [Bacteroidales bacterium]